MEPTLLEVFQQTGQGLQDAGMGAYLILNHPDFDTLDNDTLRYLTLVRDYVEIANMLFTKVCALNPQILE